MGRGNISDARWKVVLKYFRGIGIYHTKNLRRTLNGIIFRIRTGIPWRDLPARYGKWNTVYKRFREWSKSEKFQALFYFFSADYDLTNVSVDTSYVKCHQHSSGARHGEEKAIGKSAGGTTTKIHASYDSYARPISVTEGGVHDSKMFKAATEPLVGVVNFIADKAYDSSEIREHIIRNNGNPVIPRRKNSKNNRMPLNKKIYRIRNTVENFFARIKANRGIATRYDKTKQSYEGALMFMASMIWVAELAKSGKY